MNRVRSRGAWLILLGLLVGFSGCQTPSGASRFSFWPKPSRSAMAQAASPPEISPPLLPEQKADIQLALAISAERQGRTDEAKKMYQEVLKTLPQRADVYHRLGLLHSRQGDCLRAEEYYQKGIQLDPEDANLHCDLGYNHYLQQRWAEAEGSLRQAIALDGDLARARNNLGVLLARTGREAEAMREFALAGCDPAQASANLAFAMALEGRVEHAQQEYRRALQIDPNLQAARQGLASLDSLTANQPTNQIESARPAASWPAAPASHVE